MSLAVAWLIRVIWLLQLMLSVENRKMIYYNNCGENAQWSRPALPTCYPKCYWHSDFKANFTVAKCYCQTGLYKRPSILAEICSSLENSMACCSENGPQRRFGDLYDRRSYIGITDRKTEGVFRHESDDVESTWSNWAPGFPYTIRGKGNDTDCTVYDIQKGWWYNVPCWEQHFFICENNGGFTLPGHCLQPDHLTVTECLDGECVNGGTPVVVGNKHQCKCSYGWAGILCNDTDQCVSSPCRNSGTCLDIVNGYTCTCTLGWTGAQCEQVDECASQPCSNKGTCVDRFNGYSCTCASCWKGANCETKQPPACLSAPCRNGATCVDATDCTFKCTCQNLHDGPVCEYSLPGEAYFDCPVYATERERLVCNCDTTRLGNPQVKVGWSLGAQGLQRILIISSISRANSSAQFICQQIWERPGYPPQRKHKVYKLLVAYGPTDTDSYIDGPKGIVKVDGLTAITLTCLSRNAVPKPLALWTGILCKNGNYAGECTFVPDPETKNGTTVTCHLSSEFTLLTAKAQYTLSLLWAGAERVTDLAIAGLNASQLTSIQPNQLLNLQCTALGNPKPNVQLYWLQNVHETEGKEGGERRVQDAVVHITAYRVKYTFNIQAPGACGALDTYRCEANNTKNGGHHWKTLTVQAACNGAQQQDPTIVRDSIVGSLSAVAVIAALALWVQRRRKRMQSLARERQALRWFTDRRLRRRGSACVF